MAGEGCSIAAIKEIGESDGNSICAVSGILTFRVVLSLSTLTPSFGSSAVVCATSS